MDDELAEQMEAARAHFGARWPDDRATRVAQALDRRRRRRAGIRVASAGMAALATLVGAVFLWQRAKMAPTPTADLADRTLRFEDGSTAAPLAPDTVLRAMSEPGRVVVAVDRGGARFDVVHDPARAFVVDVGDVHIEDRGTRFVVERTDRQARVSVDRGRVVVAWPTGRAELGGGERGVYPPEALVRTPAPSPDRVTARPAVRTHDEKTWRTLADEGDFDQAYEQLPKLGTPDFRDEPGDLLAAADVARLSHHPGGALDPLHRVLRDHGSDPRAPVAAFTLGRILLEDLGRPDEAAQAFATAQALAPAGPLAPDALAREIQAWSSAGDTTRARERAKDYLKRFPDGSRVRSVRRYGGLE